MLTQELLNKLKEIVKEDFGKNLNDEELFEFENNLLSYFELLAKIHTREKEIKSGDFVKFPQKLTFQQTLGVIIIVDWCI